MLNYYKDGQKITNFIEYKPSKQMNQKIKSSKNLNIDGKIKAIEGI
jgi:hypothetical protein